MTCIRLSNKNQRVRNILPACFMAVALALSGTTLAATQSQINSSAAKVKSVKKSMSDTEAAIKQQEKELWELDKKVLEQRKQVREERNNARRSYHEAKRELKRQAFEIERIEKDLSLVEFDMDIVRRDMERDQRRHQSMNLLKQRLAESDYLVRQKEFNRQLAGLEVKKAPLVSELASAKETLQQLRDQLLAQQTGAEDNIDQEPSVSALINKRDQTTRQLDQLKSNLKSQQNQLKSENQRFNQLVNEFKRKQKTGDSKSTTKKAVTKTTPKAVPKKAAQPKAKPFVDPGNYHSYVFAISGDQVPNIERSLRLKSWVESYNARYIEASWNGFSDGQGPKDSSGFQEAFHEYIRQIPKDAKLILIGHGLGGGAAIDAATRIATKEGRMVDLLAVLDPMGADSLRANIVYEAETKCGQPDPKNTMTNSEYIECIKAAKKREITANVRRFYNRWQKDAKGPMDYQREIPSLDVNGKVVSVPTASGRFNIANGTESDQRRIYFAGAENAHTLLLQEQSRLLPKLLVQHLR